MSILTNIWKARNEILEGIKNNIFKTETIEAVAEERLKICNDCEFIDREGSKCYVSGTQPCCGGCGCSLKLKLRSMSSSCPKEKWGFVLTEEEEDEHDVLNPEEDVEI